MNLFIDDDMKYRRPPSDFIHINSLEECKRLLQTGNVDIISLDHDLGEDPFSHKPIETYSLALWMAEHEVFPNSAIYLHTANPVGRQNLFQLLSRYKPDHVKIYPYPYKG